MELDQKQIGHGMRLSLIGICFFMAFASVTGGPAVTGLLMALKASSFQYSIISTLLTISAGFQIIASYFMESVNNKKFFIILFGSVQRLAWILIALFPLLFFEQDGRLALWSVVLLMAISTGCGAIYSMAYFSWIGDFIPKSLRGDYYSRRIIYCAIVGVAINIFAGGFLSAVHNFTGFAVLFFAFALVGVVESALFSRIPASPSVRGTNRQSFFKLILKPLQDKSYRKFIIAIGCWSLASNLAAPFFTLYMLGSMKMSYLEISLLFQVASFLSTILLSRRLGLWVDRFQNKSALIFCCFALTVSTLLWCLATPKSFPVVAVISFISGIAGAGFEMATVNLSINLAPEKSRPMFISAYTLIGQVLFTALGKICGGTVIKFTSPLLAGAKIPFLFGYPFSEYDLIFLLSGVLMFGSTLLFFRLIEEQEATTIKRALSGVLHTWGRK